MSLMPDVLRAPTKGSSPAIAGTAIAELFGAVGATHCALGFTADYSATVSAIKTITFKKGSGILKTGPMTACTLSLGSTKTEVASALFQYAITETTYAKTAVAVGTSLAAGTIPTDKWGLYLFSIDSTGAITSTAAAANFTTGYATEAAAIAALPATPAGQASMGYVTVQTKVGTTFIGGTDDLATGAAGNVANATNYYSTAVIVPSTSILVLRWDFTAGPCYLPLPGVLRGDIDGSLSVELESSGGAQTGRVTIFGVMV